MKNFFLKTPIFNMPVLGRVQKDLTSDPDKSQLRLLGGSITEVLTSKNDQNLNNFRINNSSLPDSFADNTPLCLFAGDIILFNNTGYCTVLYEESSYSNSLFPTERCNCCCIMCPQPPSGLPDTCDLSSAIINLILNPPECIGITGGEPTLAWQGLIDIINRCKNKFPKTQIQLLTNARRLKGADKVEKLAESGGNNLFVCVPLYSDVSHIHDEIVGISGAFWETIQGIYNLERFNIPVEIRIVVINQNYQRLSQWSDFIYRFFPFSTHIAFMGLEPIGLAFSNLSKVWIDPIDYIDNLESAIQMLKRVDLNTSIYNHQLCTLPRYLWRFAKRSISEWKNVYAEECYFCRVKYDCGGFFQSSRHKMSRGIKAVR